MIATKDEARAVAVDLRSKADSEPDTRKGARARQMWHNAAAAICLLYGLEDE